MAENNIWDRWLRQTLVRITLVVFVVGVGFYVYDQMQSARHQRVQPPQRVTLLDDLPPPPPEEEEIQQPEIPEEEIEIVEEPDVPDELPSMIDDALGLDASGMAGADAFGLHSKRGGRSLLETGQGGMNPMIQFGYYAAMLERTLSEQISDQEALNHRDYAAEVRVWVGRDGRIDKCEVTESSGNRDVDRRLQSTLTSMCQVEEPPPADMPQPITIRITSRHAG